MKRSVTIILIFLIALTGFSQEYNQVDSKGRKQGEWRKVYEGKNVYMYKGQFKDDKPVGKFTYFYDNGKVKAVIDHGDGSGRSEAFFYHPNSKLMSYGIYRNLKKDSVWLSFGPSGKLSNKTTYKNDSIDGVMTIYFVTEDPNDTRQIVSEVYNYVNGKREGDYVRYFISGVVMEKGKYVNNRKDGIWEEFHPNGKRAMLKRYKNGVEHGWWVVYNEKMERIKEVYYCNGKILEGTKLERHLKMLEEKGIDPNG